jgi:hypothetical protein
VKVSRVPKITEIEAVHGDTLTITMKFTKNRRPLSKVGSTWDGQLRVLPDALAVEADFTFDTADAAKGIVRGVLSATDTEATTIDDTYHWDLQETGSGGVPIETRARGTVVFRQDVTRP